MEAELPVVRNWRPAAAIAATAILSSISGLRNDFVFDDVSLIEQNARIHDLGGIAEIMSSAYWPPPFAPELYRPMASILHAIVYVAGGGGPVLFRIVSYLLYAASAIAVFTLARRIVPPRAALLAGLLFAAHPLHVEAVALGVNHGELIVAIIAAFGVARYIDLRRSTGVAFRDWLVFALAYGAAMLIKENAFMLPALFLAADLLVLRAQSPPPWRDLWKGYFAMGCVALGVIALRAMVLGGSPVGAVPAQALQGLGLPERAMTMLQVVPIWLRLLAWPAQLQMDYSPNEIVTHLVMGPMEWLGLAIVLAWVAAILGLHRRMPAVSFGLLWCAAALLPVSNVLVPTGIMMAERTLFLPSVGFVIAAAASIELALRDARPVWLRRTAQAACAILLVLGLARSFQRHKVWKNSHRLWLASAVDAPRSLRVQQAHREAVAEITAGFVSRAEASPSPWRDRYQLALLLRAMKADSEAVIQLRESLRLRPVQTDVQLELAVALVATGRYTEARGVAGRVSSTSPDTTAAVQFLLSLIDSLTLAPPSRAPLELSTDALFAVRR